MRIINIQERERIVLDNEDYEIAKKMKENDKSLPFTLMENSQMVFDDYIVGCLQISDTIINIIPRHSCISLYNVFEMILYTDFDFNLTHSNSFDFNRNSGIFIIPSLFMTACLNLVTYGLTGGFLTKTQHSNIINGRLIFDDFNKKLFPYTGLCVENCFYTNNVLANQIIKTALLKILNLANDVDEINRILTYFDDIDECSNEYQNFNPDCFFSSNPHYKEVLSIALIILNNLNVNYSGNKIEWLSFLCNSNDLFEKYARKVVKNVIELPVEKWEEPRNFAYLEHDGNIGYKSYAPDILINYNKEKNNCFAILDVKNKEFNLEDKNLPDLVQSADLYQMLFYAQRLNNNRCGLIYPANSFISPIRVNVSDSKELNLYLLTLNMSANQDDRLKKFKSNLFDYFFRKY